MGRVQSADLKGLVFPLSVQVEELGSTFVDSKGREFRYMKYNDGDGDVPGCRGQIVYLVPGDADVPSYIYEVTVDLSSTTVPSQGLFAGVIIPDVILNGEYCWAQIKGINLVPLWADITAIDRSTSEVTKHLMPAAAANENIAGDGIVGVSTEALDVNVFGELLADVDGTPTLPTDRVFLHIPAGQTATPQFIVGETITGGTSSDTAVVVEVLRRGAKDYGLIVSTVTATYFHTVAETVTGGTSAAAGSITTKGEAVRVCQLSRGL